MREEVAYEYLGLSVQDGKLWPDRPVKMRADCLDDLLEVLISEGWEFDPGWGPTEPRVILRRSRPTAIHQTKTTRSVSPGRMGSAER